MEIGDNKYYLLQHKDIPLGTFSIDENGDINHFSYVKENFDHFPIAGKLNFSCFKDWWKSRSIPENREGIQSVISKLGYKSVGNALVDNLALSLTDCYWIKPINSTLKWKDVNLFQNDFTSAIGSLEFNLDAKITKRKKNKFDIASSSGELKKKWFIDENGKRILIKGNRNNSYQQSINEVLISKFHEKNNPQFCLKYSLIDIKIGNDQKILGCKSENFCSEDVELVTANDLIRSYKIQGSSNLFLIFKKACLDLGMQEDYFHSYIDYLIVSDILFSNIDRHMNNIGILRNPDTLQLIGFAPIYDSGNSMFYNVNYEDLCHYDINKIKINSFFEKELKMLSYVKNKNCIDLDNVDIDFGIYSKDIMENQIRYPEIEKLFKRKILLIKRYQKNNTN